MAETLAEAADALGPDGGTPQRSEEGGLVNSAEKKTGWDIDRDGDIDLAVGGLSRVRLLRNDAPAPGSHWLSVRAVVGKRDALGAEVVVVIGERRLRRLVHAAHSYASSSDPRAHFGLGVHDAVDAIEIRWPQGNRETFAVTAVDSEITLRRGEGVAW